MDPDDNDSMTDEDESTVYSESTDYSTEEEDHGSSRDMTDEDLGIVERTVPDDDQRMDEETVSDDDTEMSMDASDDGYEAGDELPVGKVQRKRSELTSTEEAQKLAADENFISSKTRQGGKKHKNDLPRPPRSFAEERGVQLLRQLSSQLLFAAKADPSKPPKPVEVQAMRAGNDLYIAVNDDNALNAIKGYLADGASTRKALGSTYFKGGFQHDVSERFATKLDQVLDGSRDFSESEGFQAVKKLLRSQEHNIVEVDVANGVDAAKDCFKNESKGKIFLVKDSSWSPSSATNRHAEAKLMELVKFGQNKEMQYELAGKKRPCTTCGAHLQERVKEGFKVNYTPHVGRYWQAPGEMQTPRQFQKTRDLVKSPKNHGYTVDKNGKRQDGYNSFSDSEAEARKSVGSKKKV